MKIILIRHGETMWNLQKRIQGCIDTELNENGIIQAQNLGIELKSMLMNIDKIYTSPLKRAKKTAEIIAEAFNIEIEIINNLKEMNFGLWEGKKWDEIEKDHKSEFDHWFRNRRYTRVPNGESYQDLLERFVPSLQELVSKETENVIVVTHSGNIMSLLSAINHTPFEKMLKNYKIGNTGLYCIESKQLNEFYK